MALPVGVTQNRGVVLRGIVLDEVEGAADLGRHSQHAEEVWRHPGSGDTFGLSRAGAIQADIFEPSDAVEHVLLASPFLKIEVGGGNAFADHRAEGGILLPHHHQAVRVAEGKFAQQHGIHDAEDGGVCADTEGQHQDHRQVKDRCLADKPQAKADVLGKEFIDTYIIAEDTRCRS